MSDSVQHLWTSTSMLLSWSVDFDSDVAAGWWPVQPMLGRDPHGDICISRSNWTGPEDTHPLCTSHHLDSVQEPQREDQQLYSRNGGRFRPLEHRRSGKIFWGLIHTKAVDAPAAQKERPTVMETPEGPTGKVCLGATGLDVSKLSSPVSPFSSEYFFNCLDWNSQKY